MVTRNELVGNMERGKAIKHKSKEKGVPIWWLSKAYGINDSAMSKLLRALSVEDYRKLNNLIDELAVDEIKI